MKHETMKILFVIKKSSLLKNGEAPIVVRVTINGVSDEVRIQRSVLPRLWNQARGCCKGRDRVSIELNDYIESLKTKIHNLHKELLLEDALITPSHLLKRLFNKGDKRTFLNTMEKEIKAMEALIGIEYEKITINRYWNCYRCLKACVQSFYEKEDIVFPELSRDFIIYVERHMRLEKRLCQNTLVRYMKCFKKFVNMGLNMGWMRINPFAGIQYRQQENDPTFLTLEEVKTIAGMEFPVARLNIVRDMFLFSCFTGLAFIDVQQLAPEHIVRDNNGNLWIRKPRQKTKNMCNIPLLDIPQEILRKYADHSTCRKKGVLLPVPCNQKMNSYLKEIADICMIRKNLTTHCARHSYATSVCLANGVSLENVAKMLGHSNIKMTQHYARVLDSSILRDMMQVRRAISKLG